MAFWTKVEIRCLGIPKSQCRTIIRADVQQLEVCPDLQIGHKNLFLLIMLIIGKVPNLNFEGEVNISYEPIGSWLSPTQNNIFTNVTHLGEVCSESLQKEKLRFTE